MNPKTFNKSVCWRHIAALTAVAVLGGCASFSPDGGFGPVEQTAKERLSKDVRWARSGADRQALAQRVSEFLAKPLTADDAVQVALLNNPGLQADFAELGIGGEQRLELAEYVRRRGRVGARLALQPGAPDRDAADPAA